MPELEKYKGLLSPVVIASRLEAVELALTEISKAMSMLRGKTYSDGTKIVMANTLSIQRVRQDVEREIAWSGYEEGL